MAFLISTGSEPLIVCGEEPSSTMIEGTGGHGAGTGSHFPDGIVLPPSLVSHNTLLED